MAVHNFYRTNNVIDQRYTCTNVITIRTQGVHRWIREYSMTTASCYVGSIRFDHGPTAVCSDVFGNNRVGMLRIMGAAIRTRFKAHFVPIVDYRANQHCPDCGQWVDWAGVFHETIDEIFGPPDELERCEICREFFMSSDMQQVTRMYDAYICEDCKHKRDKRQLHRRGHIQPRSWYRMVAPHLR